MPKRKSGFRNIITIIILILIIGGGILAYYYWQTKNIPSQPEENPKEESQAVECSSIDVDRYQIAGKEDSWLDSSGEINFDINSDGKEELLIVYEQKIIDESSPRNQPILFKIFSGSQECQKEEFSYRGREKSEDFDVPENEVSVFQVEPNFLGDGKNIVMLEGIQTAYGSGSSINEHLFAYKDGKYLEIATLEISSNDMYKFSGEGGLGKEIIVARMIWGEGECHFCPHRYEFEIYTWDGNKYLKIDGGITENKYSPGDTNIESIIQAEPGVLK